MPVPPSELVADGWNHPGERLYQDISRDTNPNPNPSHAPRSREARPSQLDLLDSSCAMFEGSGIRISDGRDVELGRCSCGRLCELLCCRVDAVRTP